MMGVLMRLLAPSLVLAMLAAHGAYAADPPTPGQIFQHQQRPETVPRLPDAKPPEVEDKRDGGDFSPADRRPAQTPSTTSATRRVPVKAFRLTGLTVASEPAVQPLLEPYRNREATLTQLHEAATVVQDYLTGLGFFVRVYVPTQDVKDGIVELRVVESRISSINVQRGEGLRIGDETLRRYFSSESGEAGGLLSRSRMEHDLLLLNDLAGVRARAILVPGTEPGSTTLLLSAQAEPFVQGFLSADNSGNKFAGRARADADVRLNSPLGAGDLLSARASVTAHSNFARVAYTMPVGPDGLSLGMAYSLNDYKLCCEFEALNQEGWARSGNLFATYPLVRSLSKNVSASLVYGDRRIVGRSLGALSSDHRLDSWTPVLYGDWQDKWWGMAARSSWSAQVTSGRVDLSTSPDRAGDIATAGTGGRYDKAQFNFARVQKLGVNWTLLAAARGQFASKNLDSSEKLILGGLSGVRAYPTGEAVGDAGLILSAELQREIVPQWVGSLFLDYGRIQLHKNPWANWEAGNPNIRNKYSLNGGGIGVTWMPNPRIVARAILATPFGSNPGRDVNGRNSENTRDGTRVWASLSWSF